MTSHKWKKDRDGAESCEREGCTVRRWKGGPAWQEKKGRRWNPSHMPIPPCTGKDAVEEKPAPSPLEVVRGFVDHFASMDCMGCTRNPDGFRGGKCSRCHARECITALATLEESIRKDERAKVAEYLRGRKDAALGFGHAKRAEAFADAAEEVANLGTK